MNRLDAKMSVSQVPKYYYSTPFAEHNTGDIWKDMPTNGLIKLSHCSGIVITPSCDLSNNKVETVTYLPIVPVDYWFCSRNFYQIARAELLALCKQEKIAIDEYILAKNFIPKTEHIETIEGTLEEYKKRPKVDKVVCEKIQAGLLVLQTIISNEEIIIKPEKIKVFLGDKRYNQIKEKLICNSQSNDLHFLPKDGQSIEWSPIDKHSIVLFRYPITAPIEIFDLASDSNCLDWELGIKELQVRVPFASFFTRRPLKALRLNQAFLGDLLTRFVSVYVRLGSPDFTSDTIQKYIEEI